MADLPSSTQPSSSDLSPNMAQLLGLTPDTPTEASLNADIAGNADNNPPSAGHNSVPEPSSNVAWPGLSPLPPHVRLRDLIPPTDWDRLCDMLVIKDMVISPTDDSLSPEELWALFNWPLLREAILRVTGAISMVLLHFTSSWLVAVLSLLYHRLRAIAELEAAVLAVPADQESSWDGSEATTLVGEQDDEGSTAPASMSDQASEMPEHIAAVVRSNLRTDLPGQDSWDPADAVSNIWSLPEELSPSEFGGEDEVDEAGSGESGTGPGTSSHASEEQEAGEEGASSFSQRLEALSFSQEQSGASRCRDWISRLPE